MAQTIQERLEVAKSSAPERRARRLEAETKGIVFNHLRRKVDAMLAPGGSARGIIESVRNGETDPYDAAGRIVQSME